MKNRTEIEARYKWRTEDMYTTSALWEEDYKRVSSLIPKIEAFDKKLTDKESILACLKSMDELGSSLELLAVYAHMRRDEDTSSDSANQLYSRVINLYGVVSTASAFIEPQLSMLDTGYLRGLVADLDFSDYTYMLERLIAQKPHILSEGEERVLALSSDFLGDFSNIFTMIDNADLDFPKIKVDGKDITVTHGEYSKLLQSSDQATRKKAFDAYYGAYEKLKNTIAATYYGEVKKDIFLSKARRYDSYLQKAMTGEDVPADVYYKLIQKVGSALPAMHGYVALRKSVLGLKKLYMYDLYTPIVKDTDMAVDYDEACRIVKTALAPLGDEYAGLLDKAFSDGWIDVYETKNKRSGGYCTHAQLAPHPYILLNYARTTHDVFTLAHELGHAMHSHYSSLSQPAAKADYKIFVAEVASTVNEMLLLEHLLSTTKDIKLKKFLLSYRLDTIRTTIFRQTMFSEFELSAHTMVEEGKPLTVEELAKMYALLNTRYYGDAVESDAHIRYEWSRIPHFYMSFYVYKYATGLIAAIDISKRLLSGGEEALSGYKKFLCAGGSKSPYGILCDCGVDLMTDAPYDAAIQLFSDTVKELKELCEKE